MANFRGPLITALRSIGAKISVMAPDWDVGSQQLVGSMGAETTDFNLSRAGLNPLRDLATLIQLWRYFRVYKPRVVFTYAAKTNIWGMLAAALAGVPHRVAMVEGMGYAFTEGVNGRSFKQRWLGWVIAQLYRVAFRLAHKVVVLNADDARELQQLCGLRPDKTVLLGGIGVPLQDWPLCLPHTRPVTFTLIARLLREKGIFEYLQAARLVKSRYPHVRFWLLGGLDTNPGAVSEQDIKPWLDDGVVEWPGQVNVKPWLAQTSVFVLPSYREGVPRSTQEAMAMGRPVITTDVPGCRETVVDSVNGYMVPPRDVPALVAAMERFIKHPELIGRMGAESRRLAEERFDVRVINQKLLAVLGLERPE
ncbi:glycosyltransferase family 4 protein [Aquabacterium sp. A08]|uniref:glycosyltransferase family 4 protein n=1 Tax=Aquabacterium sp. A08 TaxID=2718532 RepID=UPI0035302366